MMGEPIRRENGTFLLMAFGSTESFGIGTSESPSSLDVSDENDRNLNPSEKKKQCSLKFTHERMLNKINALVQTRQLLTFNK